ncbi:MAG: primosomal protein N' [Nitrospirae bacterium]|nr:primosomal protein N' [Nitrospirota bacterium]
MSSSVKIPSDTSKGRIALVAIPRRLDKVLSYAIPDRLIGRLSPGMRLLVPLGRSKITGYLIGVSVQDGSHSLKEIIEALNDTPIINNEILELARWASEYYMQPLGLMIRAAIPGGNNLKSREYFKLTDQGTKIKATPNSMKGRILSVLKDKTGWVPISELSKDIGVELRENRLTRILSNMKRDGILDEDIRIIGKRDPSRKKRKTASDIKHPASLPSLYGREADLVNEVKDLINKGTYTPYLLAEIKKDTRQRIYLHLISLCIEKGKGVLLLIPEISPNLSLIKTLEDTFSGRVGLLHSRISEGRRFDILSRIREGKIDIIVGTRSAIFAPIDLPGMIIVDEEDDPSYKQDKGLRYNAKGVALKRGERLNIPVILGSSAPSVEDFYYGMTGVYKLRTLPEEEGPRIQGSKGSNEPANPRTKDPSTPQPLIKIVDMRGANGRTILSDQLNSSIANRISKGDRVLLFVNKRGFSNSIICQDCGYSFRCPDCALSMTYYKGLKRLSCHYCNKSACVPETCPDCGSSRLTEVGIGTERVEEEVRKIFPSAKVVRLDKDTIKGSRGQGVKGSSHRTLEPANPGTLRKEGEIVIGTDIVLRSPGNHPFALVGVVSADTCLHLPDFRLSHRVYKLLRGLIDLAGKGEVIIQTHNPSHHAIEAVSDPTNMGLDRFYQKEIGFRRELGYPPFSSMVIITLEGGNAERCMDRSQRLGKILHRNLDKGTELLGPARGYPEILRGRHRWQMIIKGDRPVQEIIRRSMEELNTEASTSGIRIDLDIDP